MRRHRDTLEILAAYGIGFVLGFMEEWPGALALGSAFTVAYIVTAWRGRPRR